MNSKSGENKTGLGLELMARLKDLAELQKTKKNPDRCLPMAKAKSLSQSERAATAKKKKRAGSRGKQFVANTPRAKVSFKRKKA